MRKYIIICLIMTVLCGGALFYVSQKTRDARDDVITFNRKINQEEEAIRILKAEWSYLNRPQRLEKLAKRFLDIKRTKPYQFVRLEDIKIASNIVVEFPRKKLVKPKVRIARVKNTETNKKTKVAVIKKFKDRIESLLDNNKAVIKSKASKQAKGTSRFYNNMAFRHMIGSWGNE